MKIKSGSAVILMCGSILLQACDKGSFKTQPANFQSSAAGDPSSPSSTSTTTPGAAYLKSNQVLEALPTGADQLKVLCARGAGDKVAQTFCSSTPPQITSLTDLESAVGLGFTAASQPRFALTAHSTSLVEAEVSAINPRAILFSNASANFVTLGFSRGDEFVEIAAGDPKNTSTPSPPNFYLVKFKRACDTTNSCGNSDNLTFAVESNWTSVSIYSDEDLKNTVLDCRQCHTSSHGKQKFLRMQEFTNPWTHWMQTNLPAGESLMADFHAAHGNSEEYAGIPANLLDQSDPPALQATIQLLLQDQFQTNLFDSPTIETEVQDSNPSQPQNNTVPGFSQTWLDTYNNFLNGQTIQVPYHDAKVTDPAKLSAMTQAYSQFLSGALPPSQLPDIRDIFPDNPALLADMGLRARPGLTPPQILLNVCAQCHNSNLDQTISRSKFDATNLNVLSDSEKYEVINRISAPVDSLQLMPPHFLRSLSQDEIKSLVTYLTPAAPVSFQDLETTIFTPKCVKCHSGATPPGGYSFDTYAGVSKAITLTAPVTSPIYTNTISGLMPKGGPALSSDEESLMLRWIQNGAPNN